MDEINPLSEFLSPLIFLVCSEDTISVPGIICGTIWGSFPVLGSFAVQFGAVQISHYALVSSRQTILTLRDWSKGRTVATLDSGGIRPGNGIQRDNMNRKVESKLTRSIWIGRRSCYAWPSRDPRSKCYAWCALENSILCIPCIRGGRLKISAKSSQSQTIQLRRMRL